MDTDLLGTVQVQNYFLFLEIKLNCNKIKKKTKDL